MLLDQKLTTKSSFPTWALIRLSNKMKTAISMLLVISVIFSPVVSQMDEPHEEQQTFSFLLVCFISAWDDVNIWWSQLCHIYSDRCEDLSLLTVESGSAATIFLRDPSQSQTSGNNLLAYRPNYQDYHNSGLGAILVNHEGVFSFVAGTSNVPSCSLSTKEEDGFRIGNRDEWLRIGDKIST